MSFLHRLEDPLADMIHKGENKALHGIQYIAKNKDSINAGINEGFSEAEMIVEDVEELGSKAASPITNLVGGIFDDVKMMGIAVFVGLIIMLVFIFPYFKETQKTTRTAIPAITEEAGKVLPMAAPLFI